MLSVFGNDGKTPIKWYGPEKNRLSLVDDEVVFFRRVKDGILATVLNLKDI